MFLSTPYLFCRVGALLFVSYKTFNTNNLDVVNSYQKYSAMELPSILWSKRVSRFEKKIAECRNSLCKISAFVR